MSIKKIILSAIIFIIAAIAILFLIISSRQETATLTETIRNTAPGKFLKLDAGWVHYVDKGADSAETVLLIHGGGVTGIEVWKNQIPFLLNKGYRVIAYDLYGRGFSDRPQIKNSPKLFNDQLTSLLDSLNIHQPIDIISMSMGAIIAVDYAKAHPDKVKKLIMLDPALSGGANNNKLLKIPVVSNMLMTLYWYPRAVENQRKEFVDQQIFNDYSKRLNYFMNFKGYKHSNYSTWMDMLNKNRIEDLNQIKSIKGLLIYGTNDPYFSADLAKRCQENYPGLQVHPISSAGHMPHFEKPQIVNPIIDSFLQQH